MDQINKQVLILMITGIAGLCALAKLAEAFEHKMDLKSKNDSEKIAKVIHIEDNASEGYLKILLDTDHHPATPEGSVRIPYGEDVSKESALLCVSNNLARPIWEWNRLGLGTFSKLNETQK